MPQKNLTQLFVDRVRPPTDKAITYFDTSCPGFGLRVSPRGRKTFIAQYRVKGGKEVLETIGTLAVIPSVADARGRARASMLKARAGIHPKQEREQQAAQAKAEAAANAFTFRALAERYLAEYADLNTKASSACETRRLLNRASQFFGDKPLRDLKKIDIVEAIAQRKSHHVGTAGLTEANALLSALRRALRWAVAKDLVDSDPSIGILKPLAKVKGRERVLSDDEIVRFWAACELLGWPFGPLFQLMLVTAQREDEVAGLRESELDRANCLWHLPGSRTKNSRAHDVHLSDLAMAIIEGLPCFAASPGKPDYLFSLTGRTPVSGFAYAKKKLDKLMGVAEDWRLHDLRRTATTGMARLNVPPHVADRVLNHQSGTISGVAAVYNKFQYLDQRRDALQIWGRFVEQLVRAETSNVVALASR
jgi:integrase